MGSRACAFFLLVAVTVGAAQSLDCPDLFVGVQPDAKNAIIKDCTGPLSCDACQCSLIAAITPRLVQAGKILSTEAWMSSSLNTIADALTQCKKEFAMQLLENTNASLSQLAGFDSCSSDVTMVSQCVSSTTPPASAAPAPESQPNGMEAEVMAEACGVAVAGSSNATACPSEAAARMVAGVLSSTNAMMAPDASEGSILRISKSNTRGAITWKANCWCDETWDPVCDSATRKQYPNTCSARCQGVATVVPCSSLEPLVNLTMAGNTAAFVIDQSLIRQPSAVALSGPMPAEASEDAQSFYYYYEEAADDTQDAYDIASTLAEALLAAKYGEEVDAVDAISAALPPALRAGVSAPNITKADGPGNDTATTEGGPLAALRNITLTRQRLGLDRRAQSQPERRNVSLPVRRGNEPPSPSWMLTSAPGYSARVYQRDAERTSRILASLMAAAQEAKNQPETARLVINIAPAVGSMVRAAAGAVQNSSQAAGGMPRSADVPTAAGVQQEVRNGTNATAPAGAVGTTNSTGNSTSAGNSTAARAFSGLTQDPQLLAGQRFASLIQELQELAQSAISRRQPISAFQGSASGLQRAAGDDASMDMDMDTNTTMAINGTRATNGTMNGTVSGTMTRGNSTVGVTALQRWQRSATGRKRRLLFF